MIAEYYHTIYLIICTILTIYTMSKYSEIDLLSTRNSYTSMPIPALLIACIIICFIGLRPTSGVFIDMTNYAILYDIILGEPFHFSFDVDNLIFDNLFTLMASLFIPIRLVFLFFSILYFGCMYLACRKLFPDDVLLSFLFCLVAFSTYTYGTNGIKAGIATSIFLLALSYLNRPWISLPLALLTYGFHHSMLLVVVAYFLVCIIKNPKWYFIIWCLSFCVAALHITWFQHYFAGFTDEHGASYLLSSRNSGFRIDFIIYSAVPVIIGYWMIFKNNLYSRTYDIILNLYLLTNSVWMLCMYANFTNRIAYLSWFLYPIVLLYPFVNLYWSDEQNKYLKYVVYGHLGFTLFMTLIYY